MVSEEQLAALDVTLWLGSTERAAEFEFSNQSTVSRRHHKVLRQFGIELKRSKSELEVSGDLLLLDNTITAHSRCPFQHPRKILCAIANPYDVRGLDVPMHLLSRLYKSHHHPPT